MPAESPTPSSPAHRWLVRLAVAAAVLLALIAVAWLAVPPVARSQLQSRLTEALGRATTVEAVDFNPFTLKFTLHKLAVAARDGDAPLLAVDAIVADFSATSLWRRAPVLDALKLVKPTVSLARGRDGRYSVQDLIDAALVGPPGRPPAFSLNNIEIEGGTIAFDDAATGRKHRIDDLSVGIPFISSLPYETEIHVTPQLSGAFNGSHFALGGTTEPFAARREATIDVDLDALALPQYVAYLPARPRFDLAGGALTTRLKVAFVDGKPEERKLEIRGEARIDGLAIHRPDGTPLAGAERIAVVLDRIDVFGRDVRIDSATLDGPKLDLRRLPDGAFEIAAPLFEQAAAKPPATQAPSAPWSVTISKASLARGSLDLTDETSGFRASLADVAVEASGVSTHKGAKARVAVSFVSADRIASFKAEADVDPLAPAATGTFELGKFSLALLFPYYKDVLAVDVAQGSLDLAAHFALEPDGGFRLTQGTATIANLALAYPGSKDPFWRFPGIAASGVDVDVRARNVTIAEVTSHKAAMRAVRERNGSIDVARLMKTTASTSTANERTWALTLGKLTLDGVSIDAEDRVPDPAVKLPVRDLSLEASNYSNARNARSTVALRARVGEHGRIAWNGTLTTNPVSLSGRVDVSGLDLVKVRPYVESQANVSVTGGTLAAKGTFALELAENAPAKAAWKGDVVVTDFAALDRPTASDLARFARLTLEGIDVATEPFRLAIGRIAAEDYYARVIVYPDATLNLTRLLTPGSAPEPAAEAPEPAAPAAPAAHEPLPITIGRIEVVRGNVNYTDLFVRPNYSANLTDVTGSVTTMSAEQAGDVAVTARVDRAAPVEIAGRILPFAKDLSLDITAKARDVDLPPLTPYSVKYAGYGIEKGKLTFDVHYRIEDRKLAADNRLVLDQLTFNPQRIDSATATKLPVLLAVALLKDTRGVIDISLPISGSLDDPQFSVGGLIVRVIVNLIAKAATAPFALLSAAFGRGEELSNLPFAPGSAAIGEDAQKRIDTLAKALADRPALRLDIGGRADATTDREALRRASVESAMKREKMKSLVTAGSAPPSVDLVTIGAEERTRWLEAAYRESSIKDRPRNFVGMLKDVPPQEMEAMLLADAKADDDALRLLANARAEGVKDALVARSIAGERLFITVPRLSTELAAGATASPAAATRVDLALR
ncbi:MAG TPA: DUF748 domain-containing protein [Casimicrobiaceae bacterium]|nr:DUF748 domain-containing protein [Casimicrobiaceae bacterium]